MEQLRGLGVSVGEYMGQGMGDTETDREADQQPNEQGDADGEADQQFNTQADQETDRTEETMQVDKNKTDGNQGEKNLVASNKPLLFFYDCEATGLSIYSDNITEVAAKVITTTSSVAQPTFSSLVHTSRRIPKPGIHTVMLCLLSC